MVADGTVKPFDGDMDDYARFVLDRARAAARGPSKPAPPPAPAPRPASAPLKRKLEAAEAALARETGLMARIDADLADPGLYAKGPVAVSELTKRRQRMAERLAEAEREWMAAAERYEASLPEAQPSRA
jgi:ATP-binding cassette subfamily F protein 3